MRKHFWVPNPIGRVGTVNLRFSLYFGRRSILGHLSRWCGQLVNKISLLCLADEKLSNFQENRIKGSKFALKPPDARLKPFLFGRMMH